MSSPAETAPLTTMASAIFFGSIVFTAIALTVQSVVTLGDWRAFEASQNPRSSALDVRSFTSVYTLLVHLSVLGMILLYAYICEYHPPYPHAGKSYDRDEFFFLTALLFVASAFTLKSHSKPPIKSIEKSISTSSSQQDLSKTPKQSNGFATTGAVLPANDATEVMNRDQTEEWKGWMQFMFLLYHYYHAEETYNSIRIMITCYVFLTGYGNVSFFYLKQDYSFVRVIQMLWRLNFLVIFLCLTQGTTYILYYICLLHTYFFLMVYVTMFLAKHVNYTKYGMRIKFGILALAIFVIWDVDSGLFRLMHLPFLGETPMLGATFGAMWEWYFRSTLDHWSTYMGMLFALNFPITSLFFRKLEAQPMLHQIAAKGIMAVIFLCASYWWVTGPFQHNKFDYNQTNAYYGWVPLMSYIYLRNMTPWLRSHTMELLHQIGKTTLETYLMQHHIWLTSDAKSLLTIIPGYPKMNFLVVTIIYFTLSRRLYQLTLFLRGMILPNDRTACIRNLLGLIGALCSSFVLAFLLQMLDLLTLTSVAVCSLLFGFLLYSTIVGRLWSDFVESSSSVNQKQGKRGRDFISLFLGFLVVFLLGAIWNLMATTGAGKIKPLPNTCEAYVQRGSWVKADACNEGAQGQEYRDNGIGALGTCSPLTENYVWGWEAAPSSSKCRLVQRDPQSLLKTLNHRKITFVGDSMIRHLYHAACRQLGDKSAGAYNTTLGKWMDFSRTYKNTEMIFQWSPFVENLKESLERIEKGSEKLDVLIMGGGAWDRLHNYSTVDEQSLLEATLTTLERDMKAVRYSGLPIVWVTPTTINTWALTSEAKRNNIREDQIEEFRSLYERKGILNAATFVLNGTSFTADRVSESYDGVHYPFSVYDAGAQILANAYDWLLPEKDTTDPFHGPKPGSMVNPGLGLMILGFAVISLFLFDGFLGASYFAAIFVPSVAPSRLYLEAFTTLHQRAGLPPVKATHSNDDGQLSAGSIKSKASDQVDQDSSMRLDDDELEAFIQEKDNETEMQVII